MKRRYSNEEKPTNEKKYIRMKSTRAENSIE